MMENFSRGDVVVADSFEELNYKQKRAFLAAADPKHGEHEKSELMLIKSVGSGVYNKLKALFFDHDYRNGVFNALKQRGITCITQADGNYPALLAQTPAPPLVLYCMGRTELLKGRCFAIVGSRRTPAATMAATSRIAGELAGAFNIVTGVADGADTAAIRGALGSGNIICVLPGGHNSMYSAANAGLIKDVAARGLVISEWPPQTAVMRYMFTVRNRIIAGISKGVLVASAPKKSGALITAAYAADYNREVFAFPHSLGISAGEGSNLLIKNGAALCTNVLDILGGFGLEYNAQPAKFSPQEEQILAFLRTNGRSHIQAVASGAGIKSFQAVTLLSALEIKGAVVRCGGNMYESI